MHGRSRFEKFGVSVKRNTGKYRYFNLITWRVGFQEFIVTSGCIHNSFLPGYRNGILFTAINSDIRFAHRCVGALYCVDGSLLSVTFHTRSRTSSFLYMPVLGWFEMQLGKIENIIIAQEGTFAPDLISLTLSCAVIGFWNAMGKCHLRNRICLRIWWRLHESL